ncbi:MAG: helix-turn-helix transcriptional regulator [Labilithrix sp.]|nr:helix-turn-helix transcriptional regulator [Labilithrix sp.]
MWAKTLVEAATTIFEASDGVGLVAFSHDPECRHGQAVMSCASWPGGETLLREQRFLPTELGPEGFRAFFYPSTMVTTHAEVEPGLGAETKEAVHRWRMRTGIGDSLGVVVHPEPGLAFVICSMSSDKVAVSKNDRRVLSQFGLHIENALRFRRRPGLTRGFLDARGRVELDATAEASRARLTAGARRLDSARRSRRDDPAGALDLWHALVDGRYSLVPCGGPSARRYAVIENAPSSRKMRALSAREVDVLSIAARGLPSKVVAYGLGIATTAVSTALRDASAKLGLTTRLDLLRIAALLSGDPRAHASPAGLTDAEQAILDLLEQGLSNAEIARHRSRSVRTIANQVASLLRKTASPTRRALIAGVRSTA